VPKYEDSYTFSSSKIEKILPADEQSPSKYESYLEEKNAVNSVFGFDLLKRKSHTPF